MHSEINRIRSFEDQNWPEHAPVDYARIAKAGFFYVGQNLEVECFACGGRISEWQCGDVVMAKHQLLDPRCPFVIDPADSGNQPLIEPFNIYSSLPTSTAVSSSSSSSSPSFSSTSSSAERNFPLTLNRTIFDLEDVSRFKDEAARLETFCTWPIPYKVDGYRLAKAGFYYLQEFDRVRCAFCGVDAYDWEAGDDPVVEHRRHSPKCIFLSNLSVGGGVINLKEEYNNIKPELGLDPTRMKDFGIMNHRVPKHLKYLTEDSRMASFDERWPKAVIRDPSVLASAGFFYTGVDDMVRCYHCGGGLQKWKVDDDPWVEHARWFPDCDFMYLVKGEEFMNEIKRNVPTEDESPENQSGTSNVSDPSAPIEQRFNTTMVMCLMHTAPVRTVLDLGMDASRVQQVVRDRFLRGRAVFTNEDELISAVLNAQVEENSQMDDGLSSDDILGREISQIRPPLGWNESRRRLIRDSDDVDVGYVEMVESEVDDDTDAVTEAGNEINESAAVVAADDDDEVRQEVETLSAMPIPMDPEIIVDYIDDAEYVGMRYEPVTSEDTTEMSDAVAHVFEKSEIETEPMKCDETVKTDKTLEEENRRLKEAKLCKICMDNDVNIVFLPCGHLVTCSSCAANLPDCPICRQLIKGTVRTFLA